MCARLRQERKFDNYLSPPWKGEDVIPRVGAFESPSPHRSLALTWERRWHLPPGCSRLITASVTLMFAVIRGLDSQSIHALDLLPKWCDMCIRKGFRIRRNKWKGICSWNDWKLLCKSIQQDPGVLEPIKVWLEPPNVQQKAFRHLNAMFLQMKVIDSTAKMNFMRD